MMRDVCLQLFAHILHLVFPGVSPLFPRAGQEGRQKGHIVGSLLECAAGIVLFGPGLGLGIWVSLG
jgi:hypothetical protein